MQPGSFHFDSNAKVPDAFTNISKQLGMDMILKVLDYKLATRNDTNPKNLMYYLKGRTGSGKSTFMPTSLLRHYFNEEFGNTVYVIEPKVILAQSIPLDIVSYSKNIKLGDNIGYLTGSYKVRATNRNKLIYMTTEIFRKQYSDYEHARMPNFVVVDEVHTLDEPMINTLKLIKQIIYDIRIPNSRKPIFIFSSATIDIELLSNYMSGSYEETLKDFSLVGYIDGSRNFDVKTVAITKQQEELLNRDGMPQFFKFLFEEILPDSIKSPATYAKTDIPCRDILIFIYGTRFLTEFTNYYFTKFKYNKYPTMMSNPNSTKDENDVLEWRKKNMNKKRILILPYTSTSVGFSSKLLQCPIDPDPESQQNEIKIFISTNVLETGKTIYTLYQIVDTGLRLLKIECPLTFYPMVRKPLLRAPTDKASVMQRLGRVGRTCIGIAYMLYSKDTYDEMNDNPYPENVFVISKAEIFLEAHRHKKEIDIINDNDYIVPNSFDTNLISSQDLCESGFITPWGENIFDIHDIDYGYTNWLMYAMVLYYICGYKLLDAVLIARLNRNLFVKLTPNRGQKMNITIEDLKDEKNANNNDILNAIIDAKMIEAQFKFSNSKSIFKKKSNV